jgi:hypothetical protein
MTIRIGDEVFKRGIVDLMPCNHRIRDVGQLDDFRRDGRSRAINWPLDLRRLKTRIFKGASAAFPKFNITARAKAAREGLANRSN